MTVFSVLEADTSRPAGKKFLVNSHYGVQQFHSVYNKYNKHFKHDCYIWNCEYRKAFRRQEALTA